MYRLIYRLQYRLEPLFKTQSKSKLLGLTIAIVLCSIVFCDEVRSEKRYIFKPGSRQAIEVETTGNTRYPSAGQPSVGSGARTYSRTRQSGARRRDTAARKGQPAGKRAYHLTEYLQVDGLRRSYYLFVPETYDVHRAAPVLLVFHGLRMSAESMPAVTGFNGIAKRNGFVVVYCQAVNKRWNDGMNNARGVDDVKYVSAVIKNLSTKVNVDKRHIFAVGLSNGGYFSQMLASARPDEIAAVAVVASTAMSQGLSDTKNRSARAIPAVFFLGTEDPLVNWNDGKKRSLGKYADKLGLDLNGIDPGFYSMARYGGWMSAEDVISYWTGRNGCAQSPRVTMMPDKDRTDGMTVQCIEYGSRGNAVTVYKIIGGFHSWPGALLLPGSKVRSCQDISAGELIWKFFRERAW